MMTSEHKLVVTLPNDTDIVVTRAFNAPADLLFEAFTQPEHVRNWWGFRTSVPVVFEGDVRVGGRYRYVMREGEQEVAFNGEYREVEAPSKLVYTEVYEPYPDNPGLVTVTIEERGDGTSLMTQTTRYQSKEVRDMVAESMQGGAEVSMDRLEEVVEGLKAR